MPLSDLSHLITILAILTAGVWTLYRFGLTRERFPKLQFDLMMNPLGMSRDKHVVEFVAQITNKGLTRQSIDAFTFRLLTFDDQTPFDTSDEEIERQLKFNKNTTEMYWQKPDHSPFVDGGMVRQFTHVTAFDKDVRFVMIYSKFINKGSGLFSKRADKYYFSKTFTL